MYACHAHKTCIDRALAEAKTICRNKDIRFTELRYTVLKLIWMNHRPAKAYDILAKLGNVASAKPPTVYRTLDFLIENGLAHKLNSLNAYVGCSHPLKHQECYFLICSDCGEVKECCSDALTQAIDKTTHNTQFRPQHVTLEIAGRCEECAERL